MSLKAAQTDKRFQVFLARSFGDPYEAQEDGWVLRAYKWRGLLYITEIYEDYPEGKPNPFEKFFRKA